MEKRTYPKVGLIAGITLLWVSLAGPAHAIPFSRFADGDPSMRAWSWQPEQRADEVVPLFFRTDRQADRAGPGVFRWFAPGPTQIAGERWRLGSSSLLPGRWFSDWNFHYGRDRWSGMGTPVSSPAPLPVGVPDGGTTALMLAGAFGGLVFLAKRRKV